MVCWWCVSSAAGYTLIRFKMSPSSASLTRNSAFPCANERRRVRTASACEIHTSDSGSSSSSSSSSRNKALGRAEEDLYAGGIR